MKIIFFERDGALRSTSPAWDDRSRRQIEVEAATEESPAVYRLETDDELVARCAPVDADWEAFDVPWDMAAVQARFPNAAPKPPPAISVTPWQAREALRLAGLLDDVEAFINGLGVSHPAYNAWHYAPFFRRDHTLITSLSAGMGLSSQQMDGLFETARGLSL